MSKLVLPETRGKMTTLWGITLWIMAIIAFAGLCVHMWEHPIYVTPENQFQMSIMKSFNPYHYNLEFREEELVIQFDYEVPKDIQEIYTSAYTIAKTDVFLYDKDLDVRILDHQGNEVKPEICNKYEDTEIQVPEVPKIKS